jgi:hypothetical protein
VIIFLNILLVLVMTAGLLLIPLGLPGTFVILGAAFLYALATKFALITWKTLLVLLAAALMAEGVEALAGIAGGKRYGSGNLGVAASIVGGIIGAIMGAPFFFGLGAVMGALLGAFAAAVLAELLTGRPLDQSVRAGWGTFLGRVAGTFTKVIIGLAMAVLCIVRIF